MVFSYSGNAQALGTWKYYLPANSAKSIAIDNEGLIYCGTRRSYLFTYDNDGGYIETYFKSDGVSQGEISKVAYYDNYNLTVLAYENADIDIWYEDKQLYIPEIRLSSIQGNKTIQDITFHENLMYLSCAFGVVVYDLDKEEVKDTYFLGEGSSQLSINATLVLDNKIYAATENGLKVADLDNPNLANYINWAIITPEGLTTEACNHINVFNNKICVVYSNGLYLFDGENWEMLYEENDNFLLKHVLPTESEILILAKETDEAGIEIDNAKVIFLDNSGNLLANLRDGKIRQPLEIKADDNGNYWLADEWYGLVKINDRTAKEWIAPNGPPSSNAYKIVLEDDKLWVAAGGVGRNGNTYLGRQAGIYEYEYGLWRNHDQYTNAILANVIDILDIVPNPALGKTWVSSYRNGLLEYDNELGDFTNKYDQTNSIIKPTLGDPESSRVRGMALDKENNLWLCNHASQEPIIVKTADDTWRAMGGNLPTYDLIDVLIDQQGLKWFATNDAGIVAYDTGEDVLDTSDDQYINFKESNSELGSDRITDLAMDKDGQIWITSSEGVYVIYCPYATFSGGCPPSRPTIEDPETGKLGYVLWYDFVRCLAIDAANRKWFGTTNGLWVFDENVQEVVYNFTTENSALPDNDISSIAINHETGEVFIGTAKGIVSYQNEAIAGTPTQIEDNVLIYPNPVRPNYDGNIAIKGLVENAEVKITDISGTLVHATQAMGGQAVWNGYLLNGQRAASGVYMVYSTNSLGQESFAGKFVIVN